MENESSPQSELFTDTVAVKLGLFAGVAVSGACVLWWGLSVESWLGKIAGPVLLTIGLVAFASYFAMEYSLWHGTAEPYQQPPDKPKIERPTDKYIDVNGREIPINPRS